MNDVIQIYIKELLDLIIIILIVVAVKRILPALSTFLTKVVIDRLVKAAEQTIKGSKLGDAKKEWVLVQLDKFGIKASAMVDSFIEAAVLDLNLIKEQIEAKRG